MAELPIIRDARLDRSTPHEFDQTKFREGEPVVMPEIPERTTFTYETAEEYKASFKTVERNGMFYTDNPDWRQYSVHMTTTSREAADREVQKLADAWKPE